MYKSFVLFLLLSCSVLVEAQPSMQVPAKTTATALSTRKPTFKWSQVTGATQYEFYLTSITTDTSLANRSLIPVASNVNRWRRYVSVGSASTDTTYTMSDTVLARNTIYFWKVRAKVGGTWTSWAYPYSYFKTGIPAYSLINGSEWVLFNHDTLNGVASIRLTQGSGHQIMDTVYNTTNSFALGGSGASKDTIISWNTTANTDTVSFTYQNAAKYGPTGSKVLTVSRGTDGVTATVALVLENSKSVSFPLAWRPGGDVGGSGVDNVIFAKTSPVKVPLTYPSSAASMGPDSIKMMAMYDSRYNEYFGFKSSSFVAAADTQKAGLLKQVLSYSNSTGSNKNYSFSFAVRKSRADYFDTWANNRPMFILKPATGDSVLTFSKYVEWESFGASPTSISYSSDGGTTFGNTATITTDTTTIDSASYTMPGGGLRNSSVVRIATSHGDTAVSGVFVLNAPYAFVTSPTSGDSLSVGKHKIVWSNQMAATFTDIAVSLDSGRTWTGNVTLNPSSSSLNDSLVYDFHGARSVSNYAIVRLSGASDTIMSSVFKVAKAGAMFTIPTAYGNPTGEVTVLLRAKDYVATDSINSFDVKITFDSTYAQFDSLNYAPLLQGNNWITTMDSSNTKATTANYVRLAGFKYQGLGIVDSAIASLYFKIKDKQSSIGMVDSLVIKNSSLAASGKNAATLDVSGSTNGAIKIYSSISGNLHYLHEDTVSVSYNISGDSILVYQDITDSTNNARFDVVNGVFDMTNRPPSDSIVFNPSASLYTSAGLGAIDVSDARLAFMDFLNPLSTRAKIAADVNEDSVVNTTDAMAIMDISVDSTYLKGIGLSNWIFVDSTALAGVEHSSDSLSAWYTADKRSITYTLTNQRSHQDFFGVLRGDVDFSYGASQDVNTAKSLKSPIKNQVKKTSSSTSILFSTDVNINVRPGDTVWIPLNVNPADTVVGGFNASMQFDPKIFNYTGRFKMGPAMPQNAHWYTAAKSDANGRLKIAATDFSTVITPIVNGGTVLEFQYIINKGAKIGASSAVDVQAQTVVDTKMRKVPVVTGNGEVQVSRVGSAVAAEYALTQNYPNPFNPSTTIEFALPTESRVELVIFNVLGQKVATLVDGTVQAGYHDVIWNASSFSSGVYFSVMKSTSVSTGQNFRAVKKLMLVK